MLVRQPFSWAIVWCYWHCSATGIERVVEQRVRHKYLIFKQLKRLLSGNPSYLRNQQAQKVQVMLNGQPFSRAIVWWYCHCCATKTERVVEQRVSHKYLIFKKLKRLLLGNPSYLRNQQVQKAPVLLTRQLYSWAIFWAIQNNYCEKSLFSRQKMPRLLPWCFGDFQQKKKMAAIACVALIDTLFYSQRVFGCFTIDLRQLRQEASISLFIAKTIALGKSLISL